MSELKPMTIIYPVMPAKDEAERAALRPTDGTAVRFVRIV